MRSSGCLRGRCRVLAPDRRQPFVRPGSRPQSRSVPVRRGSPAVHGVSCLATAPIGLSRSRGRVATDSRPSPRLIPAGGRAAGPLALCPYLIYNLHIWSHGPDRRRPRDRWRATRAFARNRSRESGCPGQRFAPSSTWPPPGSSPCSSSGRCWGGRPPRRTTSTRLASTASLSFDTLTRLSLILGIYKSLQVLYPEPRFADTWVRLPNSNAVFAGAPPLALMMDGGIDGLFRVRRLLDGRRG